MPLDQSPVSTSHCAELFWYPIGTLITKPKSRFSSFDHKSLNEWCQTLTSTSIEFINLFPFTISLFYEDESVAPTFQGNLKPNEAITMTTHLGHVFSMREYIDDRTEGEVVDYMVVSGENYDISPRNRQEVCEVIPGQLHEIIDFEVSTIYKGI